MNAQAVVYAGVNQKAPPPIAALLNGLDGIDGVISGCTPESCCVYDLDGVYERLEAGGEWRHPALAYAEALGVGIRPERYRVPPAPELEDWARDRLPGSGYVACGVRSAFRPKANWGVERWLDLVGAAPELTFVALDAEAQPHLEPKGRKSARRFYAARNVLDLTGQTPSLKHLLALLHRCMGCVSVDTGLLHLAHAAGLPVVALMGGTPDWARAPLTGAFRLFQGQAPCYPCRNATRCTREDGPHCLDGVTGTAVASALRRLL